MKNKGRFLLILGILLVVIDQVIKVLVKTHMTLGESIPVLGNWFQLLFVENKGMAFGMAFGGVVGKILLSLFRIGLSGLLIWWIGKMLKRERPVPTGVLIGLTLIAAGAGMALALLLSSAFVSVLLAAALIAGGVILLLGAR